MEALGALGLALLVAHAVALVLLAARIVRRASAWRGLVALALPPCAVVWGWRLGARRAVFGWAGTLALFGLVIVVIRFLR